MAVRWQYTILNYSSAILLFWIIPESTITKERAANTASRHNMRLSPTFKTRNSAGREKDWTANVENVVNEPRKPVAAKYRVFGLNIPVYSFAYIKSCLLYTSPSPRD